MKLEFMCSQENMKMNAYPYGMVSWKSFAYKGKRGK